jgi:transposase
MPLTIIPIDQDPTKGPHRRLTQPRPWAPMTDAEWAAIEPHLDIVRMDGRRVPDPRARINAIFMVAVRGLPWHQVPEACGKPDTVSRNVRRWAQAGLWLRLVGRCHAPDAPLVLRRMEYWICRAARRAMRVLGMVAARAVETLGAITAMPVRPIYMPRPEKADYVRNWQRQIIDATMAHPLATPIGLLKRLLSLEKHYAGRPWHKRFAPP